MIESVLKILILAWTISRFEPIKWILDEILNRYPNLLINTIYLLLTCSKCLALWIGLAMTGNLYIALSASLLMTIYEKLFTKWEQIKF